MVADSELEWALKYDGYQRFAQGPEELYNVLRPGIEEYEARGRVPEWCGVDFLRAWAFYRQREHHHVGHGEPARDWAAVLDAIRRHPHATPKDLPPGEPELSRFDRGEELLGGGWDEALQEELGKPYWHKLLEFVAEERASHKVFPHPSHTFKAFEMTPYRDVRVVILGQDPYPNPGEAHGLAFSVPQGVPKPGSLENIHKVLETDFSQTFGSAVEAPDHGNLAAWAEQGVLLLNTALTVRAGNVQDRLEHRRWRFDKQGWMTFTDAVIRTVSAKPERTVFILWGDDAKKKLKLINSDHAVIQSSHPSGRSAHHGFMTSRPFSEANVVLRAAGRGEIEWL